MKYVPLALLLCVLFTAPSAGAPPVDLDSRAATIVELAGWETAPAHELPLPPPGDGASSQPVLRTQLTPDIAHYQFDVRFGFGEYDVLRIHRVVKESRPRRPIRTAKNIFLLHGSGVGFVKFLFGPATPHLPDDYGAAISLAEADIDVWGMDLPWVLVPEEETDFTFGADWGTDFTIDRITESLSIARGIRWLTGSGFGKMNLLGYSYGGFLSFALLDRETQKPSWARHVGGFICADSFYKLGTEFEANRQIICSVLPFYQGLYDTGVYNSIAEPTFYTIGELGDLYPDDPSPFDPGLTNLEYALVSAADPFPIFNPWFHWFAGIYDSGTGMPVDLRYTSVDAFLDFFQQGYPFEPMLGLVEQIVVWCDEEDSPFDDHLGEIDIPMLYLGAAGGFGTEGFHTFDLVGSTDITIVNVSLNPPEAVDFGHIDLWTADNAPDVVWPTLTDWINGHSGGRAKIARLEEAPTSQSLSVFPNPGRAGSSHYRVSFAMPAAGDVTVAVYDVAGRRVTSLVNAPLPAGQHEIVWDGRAADGTPIADGVYFARVDTPSGGRTARFVNLR
jgi:hypothetical protein